MKIGLISTIDTNIGDDFIREGIVRALKLAFGPRLQFTIINKHDPQTFYPYISWTRYLPDGRTRAREFLMRRARKNRVSRFDNCDLIVQCGAPVLWHTCGTTTEWRDELWYTIVDKLHASIPVINLAAGSCYPWERQPTTVELPADEAFLRRIHGYCRVTTVRDHLALQLLNSLGLDAQFIPCSASLAPADPAPRGNDDGPILINYMAGGGHFDWDQEVNKARWEGIIRELIDRLSRRHRVALLCHDRKEYDLAGALNPSLERIWPKDPAEYGRLVANAKTAVCNRMHASVFMSGLGIPSVAVCTDTRLIMVQEFGLPGLYVKDVDVDRLEDQVERFVRTRSEERERLLSLKKSTLNSYVTAIQQNWNRPKASAPVMPAREPALARPS
jgi:polysaccharide pyruvyl transferase WcaK-like protein